MEHDDDEDDDDLSYLFIIQRPWTSFIYEAILEYIFR